MLLPICTFFSFHCETRLSLHPECKYIMNVMLELKKSLSVVSDFIGQRSVIYIDYPIYGNGGDLLIMHGAMKFFEGRGIKVLAAFTCSNCDYSHIDKLLQSNDCCIVLNGGGNFGDIYERHQAVRTEIYKKYQNQRILLLPQSAHYEDSNKVEIGRAHV